MIHNVLDVVSVLPQKNIFDQAIVSLELYCVHVIDIFYLICSTTKTSCTGRLPICGILVTEEVGEFLHL